MFMISALNEQLQQQLEYTLLKPYCHSWWISKMQSGRVDTLEERYAIKFCLNLEKMSQKRMECFRLLFDHLAWIEHQFLSGICDSRKAGGLWGITRGVRGVRKSIHQSWLAKGFMLLCWVFKGVQEEIPSEGASTLQIRSVSFHRNNAPVHNSILVTDYLTKMGIKAVSHPRNSPDLAPCSLSYSLSSEAVVMRQLRRWKRLWWRSLTYSNKRTSMGPSRSCGNGRTSSLQPDITSKRTRVSWMYYQ